MSMRTYGISTYGLYIIDRDLEDYVNKHEIDECDVAEDAGMEWYNDADGEAVPLFKGNAFYVDESFFIAPADRFPTLFEAAYDSKEDVLRELKERFEKYLPENFDYEGRFVHYIGTIFG